MTGERLVPLQVPCRDFLLPQPLPSKAAFK
jgi:hypothetical protein